MTHTFGYIPSPPDERDVPYTARFRATLPVEFPPAVDLRGPRDTPVRDQGQLGSCVGFGATALHEKEARSFGLFHPALQFAPLWLYYKCREMAGWLDQDNGAYPRDAMKILQKQGCSPESLWPYVLDKWRMKPSWWSNVAGWFFRVRSYHRLETLEDVKGCLASGHGLTIGMDVFESFDANLLEGGIVRMPEPGEQVLGGHCMYVCGYHDGGVEYRFPGGGYLIVKNSWGPGWGLKGYCYLPYAYLYKYVYDLWTCVI